MRKPTVFVSSTCYGLRQLRADLYLYLENAGFDPVLSEYSTFPVDPDSAALENCRKAVENKADIFVLVIGCRYGSTDEHGKSITNLEYLTARAKGIPVYVFAMRSIIDILPVWAANPGGNFTTVVDSPKLFEFVSGIRNSGEKWVFPFDLVQDIVNILRTQLAYLFADALDLRTRASGSGVLAGKYKNVSGRELRLIIERPRAWEHLLFHEALLREITASADLKRDWSYKFVPGILRPISPEEFRQYVQAKAAETLKIFENMKNLFQDALSSAYGPPGQSADPDAILYVANRVGAIYRAALDWKLDFFRLLIDERLFKFRELAAALCDNIVSEVEEHARELPGRISDILGTTSGPINAAIRLGLSVPDQTECIQEFERSWKELKAPPK